MPTLKAEIIQDPRRKDGTLPQPRCVCAELKLEAQAAAPVLALCRKIIAVLEHRTGSPDASLEVYRGDALAMTVKSISKAARLQIGTSSSGAPIFEWRPEHQDQRGRKWDKAAE